MNKDREAIYTMGENAAMQRWGGRVLVGSHARDENDIPFVNIRVGKGSWSGVINANAADLRAIAAQMIEAAEECEAQTSAKP